MKITWYGTASILLEVGDTSVMFDPYLKDLPKDYEPIELLENRKRAFLQQKTVFITHGHFDHLSSINELYNDKDCKIYLTKTPYRTLKREGFPTQKLQEISAGQEICLGDVKVRAIQGKHIEFIKKDLAKGFITPHPPKVFCRGLARTIDYLKYPESGEILFYEIEAEGKRLQIMGSADLAEGVKYPTGADLLILPHQGRKDIDEHNKKIVERLMPKRIVLDHYDDAFPPYSALIPVDDFCAEISKTIPTQKLVEGQTIEL